MSKTITASRAAERLRNFEATRKVLTSQERKRQFPSAQLSKKHRDVLAAVAEGSSLEEARRRHKVADRTLLKWMKLPEFAKRLREKQEVASLCKGDVGRLRVILLDAATDAAHVLAASVRGEIELDASRAKSCLEVLKLVPLEAASADNEPSPLAASVTAAEASDLVDALKNR